MKSGKSIIMSTILLFSIITTTIVYSAYNIQLQINGEAVLRSDNNIRITNVVKTAFTNGAYETYGSKYSKDTVSIYAALPANSSITYEVTVTNRGTLDFAVGTINNLTNSNSNVVVESNIKIGDTINKNSTKKFNIVLRNITSEEQAITYFNQYKFKTYINNLSVEIPKASYYIGSVNEKIPVVISNNNVYDISGNITCNGKTLLNNFKVPANTKYEMIHVPVTQELLDSIVNEQENKLSINIIEPGEITYYDQVTFIKKVLPVSIVGVSSNTGNVSFTQDTVNISNSLTSSSNKAIYTITFKNNITNDDYKLRNITTIISDNPSFSYNSSVDLSGGVYVNRNAEYKFDLSYNYDGTKNNTHRDVLKFELQKDYSGNFVRNGLISLATPQNSDENDFGDFSTLKGNSPLLDTTCTYADCYSDNDGKFQYDEAGGLILDSNNNIGILNIDQSMSIKDEFSFYITLKANTNQSGSSGGTGTWPTTIIAVADSRETKMIWIGFLNNYLYINSYSLVNQELYIGSYSNKITNILVTSKRGGNTQVYINGSLKKTFASGKSQMQYSSATLGDLRSGRNLKFTGTLYELLFYNRVLTTTEVQQNWNVTNANWHIQ